MCEVAVVPRIEKSSRSVRNETRKRLTYRIRLEQYVAAAFCEPNAANIIVARERRVREKRLTELGVGRLGVNGDGFYSEPARGRMRAEAIRL